MDDDSFEVDERFSVGTFELVLQYNKMKQEKAALQSKLEQRERELTEKNWEIAQLESKVVCNEIRGIADLQTDLEHKTKEIAIKNWQVQQQETINEFLSEENTALQKKVSELTTQLERVHQERNEVVIKLSQTPAASLPSSAANSAIDGAETCNTSSVPNSQCSSYFDMGRMSESTSQRTESDRVPDWIFTLDQLKNTPSRKCGISLDDECRQRREGVKIIMEIGNQMKIPVNPVLGTAATFFHRFYMFHSFDEFPREVTALGCLFLASKDGDAPKRCEDIVNMAEQRFPSVFQRHPNLLNDVFGIERILLQTFHSDVNVDLPYEYITEFNEKFNFSNTGRRGRYVQTAFTFANDSMSTMLYLQWDTKTVSIALLNLALQFGQKPGVEGWWTSVAPELTTQIVENIGHKLLDYYSVMRNEKYDFMDDPVP